MKKLPLPLIVLLAGLGTITLIKLLSGEYVAGATLGQIGIVALAAGLGFGLGWLFSPKGAFVRVWVAVAVVLALAFVTLGDLGIVGWGTYSAVATVAFWVMFLSFFLAEPVKAFMQKPTTFGSAEWATLPYLKAHGLIGSTGFRLGAFGTGKDAQPLHYDGDRHMTVIAPTRSGKGTSFIIPNLLLHRGSAIVIDPKGENAMITAEHRIKMGQRVHVVDPYRITGATHVSRFNPIDWLQMDDIDLVENAMLLADAMVVSQGEKDQFWVEEAKALLQGFILYVATSEYEEGKRNLARVRDLLLLDGDDMKLLFQRMLDSEHQIVRSTGARSLQKEEKLMANVIASAQAQTHFLDSARLRENLSASDFKFEELKTKAVTIYLVLPADRLHTFSRWLRLLIQHAVTVNARNIEKKPSRPILFMLDELPALGKLTMIEQAYSLMAGFGMVLCGVAQDIGQLKKIYGEGGYNSIVSNSGALVYMGSRDELSANFFSSLCGVTTVWNLSTAIARAFGTTYSAQGSTSNSSETTTETTTAVQRKLAFPDELMRLPSSRQLVFIENHHPIKATKTPWYEDPILSGLGRNLHKQ